MTKLNDPQQSKPAEPKGWAIIGATGTGIVLFIVRPLSNPALNALLIVVSGLVAGILSHEVEYRVLKWIASFRTEPAQKTLELSMVNMMKYIGLKDPLRSSSEGTSSTHQSASVPKQERHWTSSLPTNPHEWFVNQANVSDPNIYERFEENWPDCWEGAADLLDWEQTHEEVLNVEQAPFYEWFVGGSLNATYNCVDRHVEDGFGERTAIRWERADGETRDITYRDLQREVNEFAAVLQSVGVEQDDVVTLYLPRIPELPVAMLGCARIGAIHSVIFAGTSADGLAARIDKTESEYLITCDNRTHIKEDPMRVKADEALQQAEHDISDTIVVNRSEGNQEFSFAGRYHDYGELRQECSNTTVPPVERDATDPLFLSCVQEENGRMKCVEHTTGGYLSHVAWTSHSVLDLEPKDTCWCATDLAWIVGHSYGIYGPLALGATTVMYEGDIYCPDKHRPWEIIENNAVDILYMTPTTVRSLMKLGEEYPAEYDLTSLRLLATVGEKVEEPVAEWYYEHVGGRDCAVLDTWWQTTTGGILISSLPGISTANPGAVGPPLPGIDARVVKSDGKEASTNEMGYLTIHRPWPGMLSTLYDNDEFYVDNYWSDFSDEDGDEWIYMCKSTARVDNDGHVTICGQKKEIITISGRRTNAVEVESAIVDVPCVTEAVVVTTSGVDEKTIYAFVILKDEDTDQERLRKRIRSAVEDEVGQFARPDRILFCRHFPEKRSGEVAREIVRSLAEGKEADGSSLRNSDVLPHLRTVVADCRDSDAGASSESN